MTEPGSRPFPGTLAALFTVVITTWWLCPGARSEQSERPSADDPGILEPVSSTLQGRDIRIPNTDQSVDGMEQSLISEGPLAEDALATTSLLGHEITHVASPNDDMRNALADMSAFAGSGDADGMRAAARELLDIVLGKTRGRIYDGFAMLNFNRWRDSDETGIGPEHFPPEAVEGEYKMKRAQPTGETFESPFDGESRRVWEVDVNLLYYDAQIDSDTFLVRLPVEAHKDDVLYVNYRIYSLVLENLVPNVLLFDRQVADTAQLPYKGLDAVWVDLRPGQVVSVTVKFPPIGMIRGISTRGWRVYPPRIQLFQPVREIENAHTGQIELDPEGRSFARRNREELTLATIGEAAPEKKMYRVARAALDGASPTDVIRQLTEPDVLPRGTWPEWVDHAREQRLLPPEAWELLAEEGLSPDSFGDYQVILVFLNNEIYGDGPQGTEIPRWRQDEAVRLKLVNLDRHTHYFRHADFGSRLHNDLTTCCDSGFVAFEIMSFKPAYGSPKAVELQWRSGWGFRSGLGVLQQPGVFPRAIDRVGLKPFTEGGSPFQGYSYAEERRGGDFRFDPPPFVVTAPGAPAPFPLKEADGRTGLVIGQLTEGYGVAQMCPGVPSPGFCPEDVRPFHPFGIASFPPPPLRGQPVLPEDAGKFPGDVYPEEPVELRFPPYLRNPAQGLEDAGDIIPLTEVWRPFLWINPSNGTLFIEPDEPEKGYWADLTYAHGAPVQPDRTRDATVEMPRASGQVLFEMDGLFQDNALFSTLPLFGLGEETDETDEVVELRAFLRNFVRVRGRLSALSDGRFAAWVTLFGGPATENGCTGQVLASSPVAPEREGAFVFRCGNSCFSPLVEKAAVIPGMKLCVQSSVGGFAEVAVEP